MRAQVGDDDERGLDVAGIAANRCSERLDAAGGGADPDDEERARPPPDETSAVLTGEIPPRRPSV